MTVRPLALLALLLAAAPARAEDWKPLIDPLVAAVLKGHKSAGIVVGVRLAGRSEVFGYGTVVTPAGEGVPDGRTLFEVGSITKTFTGALLAEAVARGEVKLDDPLTKHLPPGLPFTANAAGPPTLLDLATHRSGLPVQPPLIGLIARNPANPYAGYDHASLVATLTALKPKPSGQKSLYSNLGAGLLGHALVNAAKADSYDALVRDRIGKPLKLRDTTEAPTGEQRSRLARGHDAASEPTGPWDFASLEACGGLRSTADDLLRYAAANLGEHPTIDRKSVV